MSEIHYFPRYKQQENVVTNNTLLLLLRLYEYNRFKFEKFMEALCAKAEEEIQLASPSMQFRQQIRTGKSVVDGFLAQDSMKIAIETKRADKFDLTQLKNHLRVFRREEHKLLVLLSPSPAQTRKKEVDAIRAEATSRGIQILHTSFENIVQEARNCLSEHDEEMRGLVDDYESFCSDEDLLPKDKYTLFVPPCPQSFKENVEFELYYCPATWSRRQARYLGIYAGTKVLAVGRIANIVACDVDLSGKRLTVHEATRDPTEEEKQRILGVTRKAQEHDWDVSVDRKFYLCDEMAETDFRKTSPGGIMGHRYFDLRGVLDGEIPTDIGELATQLRQRTWD